MNLTATFRKIDQFGYFTKIGSNNYGFDNTFYIKDLKLQPIKNTIDSDPIKNLYLSMEFRN